MKEKPEILYTNNEEGIAVVQKWSDFWADYEYFLVEWQKPICFLRMRFSGGYWKERQKTPHKSKAILWAEHYEMSEAAPLPSQSPYSEEHVSPPSDW